MLLNSLTWEKGGRGKNGGMFYDTKGFMLCVEKKFEIKNMFYKENFKVSFILFYAKVIENFVWRVLQIRLSVK